MARGRRPKPAAATPSYGLSSFAQNLCDFGIWRVSVIAHRSMRAYARLGWTCSALRPTVVHPCSCIELLAWHGCRLLAACSTRRYDDSPRARGITLRSQVTMRHSTATWSARAHRAIWLVLPCAQRRSKGGKNESGRLPGFQLTRTDSPVRLAVYCTLPAAVACRSVQLCGVS